MECKRSCPTSVSGSIKRRSHRQDWNHGVLKQLSVALCLRRGADNHRSLVRCWPQGGRSLAITRLAGAMRQGRARTDWSPPRAGLSFPGSCWSNRHVYRVQTSSGAEVYGRYGISEYMTMIRGIDVIAKHESIQYSKSESRDVATLPKSTPTTEAMQSHAGAEHRHGSPGMSGLNFLFA